MAAAIARAQESLAKSAATSKEIRSKYAGASAARRSQQRDARRAPRRSTSPTEPAAPHPRRASGTRAEQRDLGNSYLSQLRHAPARRSTSVESSVQRSTSWEWSEERVRTTGGVERAWQRRPLSPPRTEAQRNAPKTAAVAE